MRFLDTFIGLAICENVFTTFSHFLSAMSYLLGTYLGILFYKFDKSKYLIYNITSEYWSVSKLTYLKHQFSTKDHYFINTPIYFAIRYLLEKITRTKRHSKICRNVIKP